MLTLWLAGLFHLLAAATVFLVIQGLRQRTLVLGLNGEKKHVDNGRVDVDAAQVENRLGSILDARINRGTLLQESSRANGTKVYRNFLP